MSRPLPPSSSNVSITQLSCAPSTPFSTKGQCYSTAFCPPLPPSKLKVSTNQLSYDPHPFSSPLKLMPLNCHRSPLCTLLPQTSASLNCRMPASTPSQSKIKTTQLSYVPLYSFYLKGPHHKTGPMPPLPPSQSKVSTTQLSYVPFYPFSIKG